MPFATTRPDRATGETVDLCFEDQGGGPPVVLLHGWPLAQEAWQPQVPALVGAGLRVVTYDRRGFGRSGRPSGGHDFDTLADDLKLVLDTLDLHDATLVGHGPGGGEAARYMSRHGGARVGRIALVAAVTPCLLRTPDNPEGMERAVFDDMLQALVADRAGFLGALVRAMHDCGAGGRQADAAQLDRMHRLALAASPEATLAGVRAFADTDFRADLLAIDVPALIVHGGADVIFPPEASGDRTAAALPDAAYRRLDGAPHALHATHADELNAELVAFAKAR